MVALLPGITALLVIAAILCTAAAGLILATTGFALPLLAYLWRILAFTLLQAGLSTILSLCLGGWMALALSRRPRFAGRTALVGAMNLAAILPGIVVVFGLVSVYGRAGWLGSLLALLGLGAPPSIYGLPGILLAHVFFNAPLAARVFLSALDAVPPQHWRLAAQLGMTPGQVFRLIDLPVLRRDAGAVAGLVFLLCFSSFAVVLALGGGPSRATLDVAIYEALRFEADFGRGAALAAVQITVCAAIAFALSRSAGRLPDSAASGRGAERPDRELRRVRLADAAALVLACALVLPPIAAILVDGLTALATLLEADVAVALATSIAIALPAGALAVALAVGIALLTRHLRLALRRPALADGASLAGLTILVTPPFALVAGLYVILRPLAPAGAFALPLIVLINALMALPLALRQIEPMLTLAAERHGRLAESLGMSAMQRLKLVDWPLARRPLVIAFFVALAMSFGDLGVATFFGGELTTLPVLLHQRLGAYRMAEAASVALLVAGVTFALFLLAERLAEARRA